MLEVEHWLWVGVSFGVSLFLVWLVWTFCCGVSRRGNKGEGGDKSEDSDSFSSTQVITTRSHPRKVRRKRRSSKRRHESSAAETTTDDESSAGEESGGSRRPRRKSRKGRNDAPLTKSSSYSYKENNYGLHDPFSEWAPKVTKYRDPTQPIVHNYPKSPSVPRRQSQTTIDNLST